MIDDYDEQYLDFLVRIAWLYYKEGLTQAEIATRLNTTRARVIRALSVALSESLVEIKLCHPFYNFLALEDEIKTVFNLEDAVVVPTPKHADQLKKSLAKAGALYLQRTLDDGDVIGVAWGSTLHAVAEELPRMTLNNVSVVMLLGGLSTAINDLNPNDTSRLLAEKLSGRCFYLPVPAIVGSSDLKQFLMHDSLIRASFDMAQYANRVLVGIGDTTEDARLLRTGFIDAPSLQKLCARGAVGDLIARYFDVSGQRVGHEMDDRIIGLDPDDLRNRDNVIAVAGGPAKVDAILGALIGRYVNVIVTDEISARAVLDRHAAVSGTEQAQV